MSQSSRPSLELAQVTQVDIVWREIRSMNYTKQQQVADTVLGTFGRDLLLAVSGKCSRFRLEHHYPGTDDDAACSRWYFQDTDFDRAAVEELCHFFEKLTCMGTQITTPGFNVQMKETGKVSFNISKRFEYIKLLDWLELTPAFSLDDYKDTVGQLLRHSPRLTAREAITVYRCIVKHDRVDEWLRTTVLRCAAENSFRNGRAEWIEYCSKVRHNAPELWVDFVNQCRLIESDNNRRRRPNFPEEYEDYRPSM